MHISPVRLKMVPLAVAIMLGGLSTGVLALPQTFGPNITLDANYSLGGGATVDGMTDPSSNLYNPGSNGADFYLFKSDTNGNNVFFHTYGFSSSPTYFGARASGEGHFAADTRATFSQTFTNTSGVAQIYNFAFNVDSGEVAIAGLGEGFASLLLSIRKNSTQVIAQDFTSITQTAAGDLTCVDSDSGLAYMSCGGNNVNSAFGSGGLFNVSFGSIAAGETFTLDYDIIATVSGNLSQGTGTYYQACNDGYGGYAELAGTENGVEFDADKEICSFQAPFPGSSIARSGDPFNGPVFRGGMTISADNVAGFNVPEPGSMALLGLGLAGLAAARRRKA